LILQGNSTTETRLCWTCIKRKWWWQKCIGNTARKN